MPCWWYLLRCIYTAAVPTARIPWCAVIDPDITTVGFLFLDRVVDVGTAVRVQLCMCKINVQTRYHRTYVRMDVMIWCDVMIRITSISLNGSLAA